MRKILLTAVILMFTVSLATAQFTAGTKYLAGTVNYHMDMTDYGDLELGSSTITVAPEFGYFAMDNLLLFGRLGYVKVSYEDDLLTLMGLDEDPDATTVFVVGGKYFYNYLYAGAGYSYQSAIGDGDAITGLLIEAGYLYPITDSFFVDLGLDYYYGMSDDEMMYMDVGVGFATFF